MPLLIAMLLAVTLSPPFGAASADLIGFTPQVVTVEVSVEIVQPAALVLMRGEDVAGTELQPVALLRREDGTWGAVVELPARRDIRIVFELIPERGASVLSEPSGLIDLGISSERLTLVDPPEIVEGSSSVDGLPWIILGALAAFAALGLLLLWVRLGRDTGAADDANSLAGDAPADGAGDDGDDPGDDADDEHAGFDGVAVDGG